MLMREGREGNYPQKERITRPEKESPICHLRYIFKIPHYKISEHQSEEKLLQFQRKSKQDP